MKIVRPKGDQKFAVRLTSELEIFEKAFSEEQISALKDKLTFDNPAYATAVRFSPYSSVAVPPYLEYFTSSCGILHVPAGTDLSPLNSPPVKDCRNSVYADTVPKFVLELRKDQKDAAEKFMSMNEETSLNGIVQLPTGKGKTILALYIAAQLKMKTLVIVHKDDLVTGWQKDIALAFDSKCTPGLIKAQKKKVGDFVTIATVQTLSRMDDETLSKYLDSFGFVIMDEVHHCPASSFSVVSKFNSRYKLGLTATAERKDGLAHVMQLYFGGFCYKYEVAQEDEKDILPVAVVLKELRDIRVNPLCKRIQTRSGNVIWNISDITTDPKVHKLQDGEEFLSSIPYASRPNIVFGTYSDYITSRSFPAVAFDVYREYKKGRSCLVFFAQKKQVDAFEGILCNSMKIPQKDLLKYYGDNSDEVNNNVLKEAERRRGTVTLATYSKATEGTNVKQWEVAFLVSSLNDGKNVEQAVGRIRRTSAHKLSTALVYDYRYPNVYLISAHSRARDARYTKLGFKMYNDFYDPDKDNSSVVSRGRTLYTRGYPN